MSTQLGTAATQDSSAFATAAQGAEADAAVKSVVAGSNVIVDSTDPQNPIVSASALTAYIGNPTTAPALSSVAGGTLAATTYYAKITYVNSTGETLPSPESNLAVAIDNLLVVDSPSAATNATGYNVYVSTSTGTETKQNSSPISIGTNWTEPTSGLISGSALPSANTTGVVGGTVSSVSVATANGFLGTVTNPTTTPSITLKTSVTGILYGNGTGVFPAASNNFPLLNYTGTISNVAALRSYNGTTLGQQIFLNSYSTVGDGGGGPFYWGAYTTDNGGTIITPTGQTAGSWYRILENNMMTVCQFGGDKTGINDSTTAFSNLHTAAGTNYDIGYEGGTYKVSSLPTVSVPLKIVALGVVTVQHTGTGILWEILNANSADSGPVIIGPIILKPSSGTTGLFLMKGTFHGEYDSITCDGGLNNNVVGFEIRDNPPGDGCYYNVFQNCFATGCGTNWRIKTYTSGSLAYANDNTFINCKSQTAQFGGKIWAANTVTALNQIIVPTGTGGNFTGVVYECTAAGTTGATEPTWTTSPITDGTVTWTQITWDEISESGANWLLSHVNGNIFIGGDSESAQGYSYISTKGSIDNQVFGMWIEASGTSFPTPAHSALFDNYSNNVTQLIGNVFEPVTVDGSIDIDPNSTIGLYGNIPRLNGVQTTATITSGTAIQNLSGTWITLEVPVTFNPTSGAAATCQVGRGSSGATVLYTLSRPAGSELLDAEVTNVTLRVPPGWYYKFTVTNATLGTAEILTG